MVLQCFETSPKVHTFTSASSLNNDNIIRSYKIPSTSNKVSGETTPTGSQGVPFAMVGGHEVVQRAGLDVSTRIVYPGLGREDRVIS